MKQLTNEAFSPEESKKIYDNFLSIVGTRRDKLVKRYGSEAEKVAYAKAVKQVKKQAEEKPMEKEIEEGTCGYGVDGEIGDIPAGPMLIRLKEMVKDALKNPKKADLNKDGKLSDYEKKRGAAIEKAMQKELEEDEDGKLTDEERQLMKDLGDSFRQNRKALEKRRKEEDAKRQADYERFKKAKGLEEDVDVGHTDDEPGMLKADLYRIGKYAMELYKMVDRFDKMDSEVDFPHWWQSKITKSKGMLVSAKHYLDFEMKEPQIDAMVDVASEEGVIDEKKEPLKEYTMHGGDYRDSYANRPPKEKLTTPANYEEFEELFPKAAASRILIDPSRKQDFNKHIDWTRESQFNNTFVHVQYHELEHDGNDYFVHQTQYYNHNYDGDDFRNPRVTELSIVKNRDTEDEVRLGQYLVDTDDYIKDLKNLNIKKRVSENKIDEKLKPSMGAGAYVDDFKDSKAPQFKGKSKKKKQEMAVAAYLSAKDKKKVAEAVVKKLSENPATVKAVEKLQPILFDILKATEKVDKSQDDTEADVEELDKSIDYLSAALTGDSAIKVAADQSAYGRLASPKKKVAEAIFNKLRS